MRPEVVPLLQGLVHRRRPERLFSASLCDGRVSGPARSAFRSSSRATDSRPHLDRYENPERQLGNELRTTATARTFGDPAPPPS